MFGGYAFAQIYFAGVLEILRRAARGLHGGSGITPGIEWTSLAESAFQEEQRRLARAREEAELMDLIAAGLL